MTTYKEQMEARGIDWEEFKEWTSKAGWELDSNTCIMNDRGRGVQIFVEDDDHRIDDIAELNLEVDHFSDADGISFAWNGPIDREDLHLLLDSCKLILTPLQFLSVKERIIEGKTFIQISEKYGKSKQLYHKTFHAAIRKLKYEFGILKKECKGCGEKFNATGNSKKVYCKKECYVKARRRNEKVSEEV